MLNISSDVIRGYNDTIILYLLLDRPSYGYEISKQIKLDIRGKIRHQRNNSLLCILPALRKTVISHHSLLVTMQVAKRRTYYQITNAGREYYRMKCEEWKLTLDVVSKFIRF